MRSSVMNGAMKSVGAMRARLPSMRFAWLGLLVATAACGGRPPDTAATRARDAAARIGTFEKSEDEILHDLATIDRRIALRARIVPREEDLRRVAMAALLREDSEVAVIDGAIDPFSFDARARGLEAARKKVDGLPRDLPRAADGMTPAPALERDLLARLVDQEALRLDEERTLPRSASALVRAVVETWRAPSEPEKAAELDRWLSRRLDEVHLSLGGASLETTSRLPGSPGRDRSGALDLVRARELDDALDALEHIVAAPGFTKSTQALERVRDALEAHGSRANAPPRSEWPIVARRANAHLGELPEPDAVAREYARLEKELRAKAEAAAKTANLTNAAVDARVSAVMFAGGDCIDAVPGSRVRSMAAPPERAPACHLRHLVASAQDDASRAVALAAMHDHLVIAEWALDIARGAATVRSAEGKVHLLIPPRPDAVARYERIALARPVSALGAGEAVRILCSGDPFERARSWNALGEMPLDIAATSLAPAPAPAPKDK